LPSCAAVSSSNFSTVARVRPPAYHDYSQARYSGLSSRSEAFHLRALPEPCMTLSSHTAPDVRPLLNGFASSMSSSRFLLANRPAGTHARQAPLALSGLAPASPSAIICHASAPPALDLGRFQAPCLSFGKPDMMGGRLEEAIRARCRRNRATF